MRIAFAAEYPRRAAATMNEVVSKGEGARSTFVPSTTLVTTRGGTLLSFAARASSKVWNRDVVCRASISSPPLPVRRRSCQYFSGLKASISRSRSTIMARVGLCTLPTERMFAPPRFAASERNRVKDAPHIRSMTWRASPADARAKSISVGDANACRISPGVIAENLTLSTGTDGLTARTSS